MRTRETRETSTAVRPPGRPSVAKLVVPALLVLGRPVLARGPAPLTEEERQVSFVTRLEESHLARQTGGVDFVRAPRRGSGSTFEAGVS
jgi:hypothetical protein